jgi:serine/threonine protein kinase
VYKGLDIQTGEVVAIKQFDLDRVSSDEINLMQGEIRLLRSLQHPNIVQYIDLFMHGSFLNIVLEFVEQGSLVSVIKQFGNLSENLVSIYMAQALNGLSVIFGNCSNILVFTCPESYSL